MPGLYAQGVLPYDANEVQLLTANGEEYAFQFIRRKIQNIELTPAQLALDPCTGGVVITDVNTGECGRWLPTQAMTTTVCPEVLIRHI